MTAEGEIWLRKGDGSNICLFSGMPGISFVTEAQTLVRSDFLSNDWEQSNC